MLLELAAGAHGDELEERTRLVDRSDHRIAG